MRSIWQAALALLLCGCVLPAQSVVIRETFSVPGLPTTNVQDINNRGDRVGLSWQVPRPNQGWVYFNKVFSQLTSYTGAFPLPLASTDYLVPQGVNDLGQMAGSYKYGTEFGIFIWDGIAYTTFHVTGAAYTIATGINDSGAVVGTYGISDGSRVLGHAYVLRAGGLSTIDFPGALGSTAHGINDRGDVAGYYSYENPTPHAPGAGDVIHGFVWRQGVFSTIDYPGATSTLAIRVNNRGDVAGFYRFGGGPWQGFVQVQGQYLPIQFPQGSGMAYGLNDRGQVAGTHHSSVTEGFLAQVIMD